MRVLERHSRSEARVIPIIVRPCDWRGAPFAELQALPKNGKPVTAWASPDEAWLDVAEGLRAALGEPDRKTARDSLVSDTSEPQAVRAPCYLD